MKRKTCLTALLTLLILANLFKVSAQEQPTVGQRLALYSKPAVVRVFGAFVAEFSFANRQWRVSVGGVGSGFFINPDGYVATNAHVVEAIQKGEEQAREELKIEAVRAIGNKLYGDYRRLSKEQANLAYKNIILTSLRKLNLVQLTDGQMLPYEIKAYGAPVGEGKDVAVVKIETKNAPTLLVGDSEKVQLQDKVFAFGYPGAVDALSDFGVLDQKSALEASITDGSVSARKNTADGAPVLQVSVPITNGNSGGPAINEKGEVIGLATFGSLSRDGSQVQGFNFLVPSSTLMEFVRQAGTQNTEGVVDKYYREGLDLYWEQRYSAAIEKFQEVEVLFPAHSEVKRLIAQARAYRSEGKERGFFGFNNYVLLAVGAVGLLLLLVGGGIIIFLVLRRRPKTPVIAAMPNTSMPVSTFPTPPNHFPVQGNGLVAAPNFSPTAKTVSVPGNQIPQTMAAQPKTIQITATSFGTLTCTRGTLQGQKFDINAQGITIGRQAGVCQIVIPDGRASSKHAWIGLQNGCVVMVDDGSTNGTFINNQQSGRVSRAELKDGDVIIIGEPDVCSFIFNFPR
ncbi:MAG: trypsin-like peptidase domain-containing protein [Acidobacteriota bacterium]